MVIPDIPSSIQISIILMPAFNAFKLGLGLPIGAFSVRAFVTTLTRVTRIAVFNRDSLLERFVINAELQAIKRPIVDTFTHFLTQTVTPSNVLQVLKNDSVTRFEVVHNLTRNHVVAIRAEAVSNARRFFKVSFSAFCAFALKFRGEGLTTFFNVRPVNTTVINTIRIRGWVNNAKINADHITSWGSLEHVLLHYDVQPQTPLTIYEQICARVLPSVRNFSPVSRNHKVDLFTSVLGENGGSSFLEVDCVRSGIVPNCLRVRFRHGWDAFWFPWLFTFCTPLVFCFNFLRQFFYGFDCFGGFHSCRNGQLGRQARNFSFSVIRFVMQLNTVADSSFPSNFGNSIEARGVRVNRFQQGCASGCVNFDLESNCSDQRVHTNVHILPRLLTSSTSAAVGVQSIWDVEVLRTVCIATRWTPFPLMTKVTSFQGVIV
jgi:hypothetical protein